MIPVRAVVGLGVALLGALTLLSSARKPAEWTPAAYGMTHSLALRRDQVRIIALIVVVAGLTLAVYALTR